MERGVFQFVFKYSKTQQLVLILITLASLPFYFFSLDIPKQIVDKAIKGTDNGIVFPYDYYGFELGQIEFLLVLCAIFLILVVVNGGFKFFLNVYRGAAGERLLRRLRYQLIERVLRFPLPQFRKTSQGEVVSMVTLETEPLGGFFGDALNLPSYQGGLLLTLMGFMFVQDWKLGLAAIALYPVQAWLIPKLQRQVNALGKQRVVTVRRLNERIGEAVTGAHEVHANDTSQFELADFSSRLGRIFQIRYAIYKKKFFIKFVNNFLALLTPFFFYSIGGWLVIKGDMTVGSLIAVLGAYKDVSAPWKMLLGYYQRKEDARIKYEQLIEKFELPDLLEEDKLVGEPNNVSIKGELVAANTSLAEDDGLKVVDGASMRIELPSHFAVVGPPGGGKGEFSQLIARLLHPTGGKVALGDLDLSGLPESNTGRQISYAGQTPYIFAGSIRDNLLYGLKHRPVEEVEYEGDVQKEREIQVSEAESTGNSPKDINANWVDSSAAGAESEVQLIERMQHYLKVVGLEDDVYVIGLRQTIDPSNNTELADKLLEARDKMRSRLDDANIADFVEPFNSEKFNSNASVAENILFGTPVGELFEVENLGNNEYVMGLLEKVGLRDEFIRKGQRLAEIMVDLFQGLPADHEFWEKFSFIGPDDLPEFQAVLKRVAENGLEKLSEEDESLLVELPFKLIPARHHLGLVDDEFEARILEARKEFSENLPENLLASVEFFEAGDYNAASTIQDNILFGKRASEKAGSAEKVGEVLAEVIGELGLRNEVINRGLDFDVAIGGARLSPIQRQKLAVARSLIKQPELFILNEALSGLDSESQKTVLESIRKEQEGRSFLLVPSETEVDGNFDQVFKMESGRISGSEESVSEPSNTSDKRDTEIEGGFGEEIDVLAAIPMFASMDRSKLKLLSFASERYQYDPGQVVIKQGDVGDKAFVILEGEAEVYLETPDGRNKLVTMKKNDLFGELALLCEAPRTATIEAGTQLELMSIEKDVFFTMIAEDPQAGANVTRAIAERLERTTRDLGAALAANKS